MDLVYINAYTKFYQISSISSEDIEKKKQKKNKNKKKHIFSSMKGHNSVVYNEFSPFAIPNHSSPISMSMQSVKKIGQKLLKLESGNEALTDGRSLKRFGGYNIIPRHFFVSGYKDTLFLTEAYKCQTFLQIACCKDR